MIKRPWTDIYDTVVNNNLVYDQCEQYSDFNTPPIQSLLINKCHCSPVKQTKIHSDICIWMADYAQQQKSDNTLEFDYRNFQSEKPATPAIPVTSVTSEKQVDKSLLLVVEKVYSTYIVDLFTTTSHVTNINDYKGEVLEICECSDHVAWVADIYISRVIKACPELTLTVNTVQCLFMTALLLAMKYVEDDFYSPDKKIVEERRVYYVEMPLNEFYAGVLNISIKNMNILEKEFCALIKFNLHVDNTDVNKQYPISEHDSNYVDIYKKNDRFEVDKRDQTSKSINLEK